MMCQYSDLILWCSRKRKNVLQILLFDDAAGKFSSAEISCPEAERRIRDVSMASKTTVIVHLSGETVWAVDISNPDETRTLWLKTIQAEHMAVVCDQAYFLRRPDNHWCVEIYSSVDGNLIETVDISPGVEVRGFAEPNTTRRSDQKQPLLPILAAKDPFPGEGDPDVFFSDYVDCFILLHTDKHVITSVESFNPHMHDFYDRHGFGFWVGPKTFVVWQYYDSTFKLIGGDGVKEVRGIWTDFGVKVMQATILADGNIVALSSADDILQSFQLIRQHGKAIRWPMNLIINPSESELHGEVVVSSSSWSQHRLLFFISFAPDGEQSHIQKPLNPPDEGFGLAKFILMNNNAVAVFRRHQGQQKTSILKALDFKPRDA